MAISPTVVAPGLEVGSVGWYAPTKNLPVSAIVAACTDGAFVTVKGNAGPAQAAALRAAGLTGAVVLDPAQYEPGKVMAGKAARSGWLARQESIGAPAVVSPGCYLGVAVSEGDARARMQAEKDWLV